MIRSLTLALSLAATSVLAQTSTNTRVADSGIDVKSETQAVRITGAMDYVMLKYDSDPTVVVKEVDLTGPAVGVSFLYGLGESLGFTGAVRQGFAQKTNFSSAFSELAIGLSYAVFGNFFKKSESTRLGGKIIAQSTDYQESSLRVTLMANQYFLNGTDVVLGLSGLGLSLVYDFPTRNKFGYFAGLRTDIASNGNILIKPMQAFFGVSIWL